MSLKLGTNKTSGDDVYLSSERRLQNTVVYGAIGSGKTRSMMMSMVLEQLSDVNSGATIFCGRGDESWLIDRMANKMDREVIFLHPDSDRGTSDFLETEYRTGYEMQKELIDYVDAIQKKKIVIVDFDLAKTRNKGKQGLIKLLYHLQRAIVHNTEESPHYVFIDDAEFSLPYIEELITYGKNHNVGTTLFMSSHALIEARSRELSYFLDANCATTLVMNRLTYADVTYFDRRFYGNIDNKPFKRRANNDVVIETIINDVVEVFNLEIVIPSSRLITELEDEVKREKEQRKVRRRARPRGAISKVTATDNNVEKGFPVATTESRVFLDEDDFFKSL